MLDPVKRAKKKERKKKESRGGGGNGDACVHVKSISSYN
jgi:hypothetical protein